MPRGQNKTLILESGKELIYEQGYHATGIAEIAQKAGVPKGSFFNYFKSKEIFATEVLELYTQNLADYLKTQLLNSERKPNLDKLRDLYKEWSDTLFTVHGGKGCLAGNLAQELAIHSKLVQTTLNSSFSTLKAPILECLTLAKENGELPEKCDVVSLSSSIYNGWQGAQIHAKATGNNKPLETFRLNTFEKLIS